MKNASATKNQKTFWKKKKKFHIRNVKINWSRVNWSQCSCWFSNILLKFSWNYWVNLIFQIFLQLQEVLIIIWVIQFSFKAIYLLIALPYSNYIILGPFFGKSFIQCLEELISDPFCNICKNIPDVFLSFFADFQILNCNIVTKGCSHQSATDCVTIFILIMNCTQVVAYFMCKSQWRLEFFHCFLKKEKKLAL